MRGSRGFTLTELIMVIVVMAIVATVSVQFIGVSTQGAIDTASRQQMADAGAVISQQVSRELRSALPGSIRILDGGRCVEYVPVLAASVYLDLPVETADTSFTAVAYSPDKTVTGRIAVYPLASSNPYTLESPGVVGPVATVPAGSGKVTVTFAGGAPHQFLTHSPSRRFFVVDTPRAICAAGGFLYRYNSYGFEPAPGQAAAALLSQTYPEREVLASGLQPDSTLFRFEPPSLHRNGVVSFQYTLTNADGSESLTLGQEVHIRNVP